VALVCAISLSTFFVAFSARQHICYSALYAIARSSVRLSHGWIKSKTVEVRIMQLSTQSSPMTLVSQILMVNFTAKFKREHRERGRRMTEGRKNTQFSANKSPYLRNGAR